MSSTTAARSDRIRSFSGVSCRHIIRTSDHGKLPTRFPRTILQYFFRHQTVHHNCISSAYLPIFLFAKVKKILTCPILITWKSSTTLNSSQFKVSLVVLEETEGFCQSSHHHIHNRCKDSNFSKSPYPQSLYPRETRIISCRCVGPGDAARYLNWDALYYFRRPNILGSPAIASASASATHLNRHLRRKSTETSCDSQALRRHVARGWCWTPDIPRWPRKRMKPRWCHHRTPSMMNSGSTLMSCVGKINSTVSFICYCLWFRHPNYGHRCLVHFHAPPGAGGTSPMCRYKCHRNHNFSFTLSMPSNWRWTWMKFLPTNPAGVLLSIQ